MIQVYLGLGSNIDRHRHITAALDALSRTYGELSLSSVFESEAVGFDGSPFFNMVVGLVTEQSIAQLSDRLKQIEDANGRRRQGPKFASRTLDIDILLYGDWVGDYDGVRLPRDEITKNAFVLWPLAQIAPEREHPTLNNSFAQLWAEYDKERQKLRPVPLLWQGRNLS